MRIFYFLYLYLRKLFRLYGPKVVDWYWHLGTRTRHRVGWSVLMLGICMFGTLLWGVCMAIYKGYDWISGRDAVVQYVQQLADGDGYKSILYSGDNKHRVFKCGALTKKNIPLSRTFKDLNDVQLKAAKRLGIKPLSKRTDVDQYKNKLVKLRDTKYYHLDPMSHSVAYLVPDAADFLTSLGQRWQEYHGSDSRFIITSCLRTDADIKRLRRRNVNATRESCHRYGTTFDITYVRFADCGKVPDHKLKADLARALYDMKIAGHCYVKYEYRQSCFHVTVRPR